MVVKAYKTHKIIPNESLFSILDTYLPNLEEKSVVAIASKVVGICEGRIVKKKSEEQKDILAKKEAEYFLPRAFNQYGFMITINRNALVASAGIDESNSKGYYSLWPKDPQKTANIIREYLLKKFQLASLGVVFTDSKLTPLRWGVTGFALSHSGFRALNSYIGKPDIFGSKLLAEKSTVPYPLPTAPFSAMTEAISHQPSP